MVIDLSAVVVLGLSRTYYLRFLTNLPPMTVLVHPHDIVSTTWLALLIVQSRLVAANQVNLHMKLWVLGVALAALITIIGVWTVVAQAGISRIRPTRLNNAQHTLVSLTSLLMFDVYIALGVAYRRLAREP